MMRWVVIIVAAGLAALGAAAGWHEYQSKRTWDEAAARTARENAAKEETWRGQLAALARLRPMFDEVDTNYPANLTDERKCSEAVKGEAFFFDRWRIKELITSENPERSDLDESDFLKMASLPFWVVYTVERERASVVNDDRSLVPGSSSGLVVVFDAKTRQPVCHAPVQASASTEVRTMVRSDRSALAALRDQARSDMRWQFQYAVGDAIAEIAPQLRRPVGFFK